MNRQTGSCGPMIDLFGAKRFERIEQFERLNAKLSLIERPHKPAFFDALHECWLDDQAGIGLLRISIAVTACPMPLSRLARLDGARLPA